MLPLNASSHTSPINIRHRAFKTTNILNINIICTCVSCIYTNVHPHTNVHTHIHKKLKLYNLMCGNYTFAGAINFVCIQRGRGIAS